MDVTDSQPRDVAAAQSHFAEGSPRANLTGGKGSTEDQAEEEDAADEEFAFRLFSTAKPTQKVVLEEDVEPQGEGGLVGPGRPLSYYVVTNLSAKERLEYDFAAVSGDEILARSKTRSWGMEMPWKVTTIRVTRKARPEDTKAKDEAKRRRPGKKQRISLRKKAKVKEEKQQAAAQKLIEKEEHIKDKKKRMNRLKKLRRRAKDKEKKQGGDAGAGSGDESEGSA